MSASVMDFLEVFFPASGTSFRLVKSSLAHSRSSTLGASAAACARHGVTAPLRAVRGGLHAGILDTPTGASMRRTVALAFGACGSVASSRSRSKPAFASVAKSKIVRPYKLWSSKSEARRGGGADTRGARGHAPQKTANFGNKEMAESA